MPYKNPEKRRAYQRNYMRQNKSVLTPEQLDKKRAYNKLWHQNNREHLRVYQKNRYKKNKEKIALTHKEYRQRNAEKIKRHKRAYYQNNKEYFKQKSSKYYLDNKESLRVYKKLYNHRMNSRFKTYKKSAEKRGYEFNLSLEQFEILFQGKCHYCGELESKGVDRKDNNIGYTPENSLSCCKVCNYMKRDISYSDFKNHIKKIYQNVV